MDLEFKASWQTGKIWGLFIDYCVVLVLLNVEGIRWPIVDYYVIWYLEEGCPIGKLTSIFIKDNKLPLNYKCSDKPSAPGEQKRP